MMPYMCPVFVALSGVEERGRGMWKESPEKGGRGSRKEKSSARELKDLRAKPELQQAIV